MRCGYFEAGRCRSCTELAVPYAEQVARKQAAVEAAVPDVGRWLAPVTSREAGFRTKAKLVVTGTVEEPALGILDPRPEHAGEGVDLRTCPLYSPRMHALLPALADFVTTAALTPYDVGTRRGELKHLLVTESPGTVGTGEFLVRWVLRSQEPLTRIRKHLPALLAAHPEIAVASANLQPAPAAVLEGPEELPLTERATLPMPVNDVVLQLGPRAFFQTNAEVAAALYREAAAWAGDAAPASVLDLYCGVGGFALHLAAPGRTVHGVETSDSAVAAARVAAADAGLADHVTFAVGDATATPDLTADLVVVNPPRRGLGDALCAGLDASAASTLLYSSCNPATLARDLAALPSWRPARGRLFDMFPHTGHAEVLVELRREV